MKAISNTATLAVVLTVLSACQSSGGVAPESQLTSDTSQQATDSQTAQTQVNPEEAQPVLQVSAATQVDGQASQSCSFTIAGGPPPKPNKAADFGRGAANNTGRNVKRGIIQNIGARVAGPLGGVVAGAAARSTIRKVEDVKGDWTLTDGSPNCGCGLKITSGINIHGQSSKAGTLKPQSCNNTYLAQAAKWKLGHTFTGYGAAFTIYAKDNKTILASLKRDGINYFSGTLADGAPVTLWR